ncbi:MAG TPA: YdeI/OmpD-associated family protein [Terriglobales bacterium]|nr:YdeI/OmpD-associated family protein [Terriglobales bacterium]
MAKFVARGEETPKRLFKDQNDWAQWMEKNHDSHSGLWLRIGKKDSGVKSVTYAEALEIALCYGWIDGQKGPEDEKTWLQRFVPRSAKSIWSKINRERALTLMKNKRMKPSGLRAIEQAKANGRWEAAYDSPSRATVPKDFDIALSSNPKAKAFFATLDSANRYAILFRVQNAKKPETRVRKILEFVAMLERGGRIHPPRHK